MACRAWKRSRLRREHSNLLQVGCVDIHYNLKGFLPRLKDHLLARILGHEYDGDEREFSAAECTRVLLSMIAFSDTKSFASTIQHMIFVAPKIL